MKIKKNKKGIELTLSTIVILIILLIVLVVVIYFFAHNYISNFHKFSNISNKTLSSASKFK